MIFGGGGAAKKAAKLQRRSHKEALRELSRQFNVTEENFRPFVDAGQDVLPSVVNAGTASGLSERLSEIFNTDVFDSLLDERTRSVEGQLSAGGSTRSGDALTEIAKLPTDIGLQLENLLFGRQADVADRGLNAAAQVGALGANNSSQVANVLQESGRAGAAGILGAQQAKTAGLQGLFNLGGSIAGSIFGGSGGGALGGSIGSLVGSFFSDPRLKENIKLENFVKLSGGRVLGLYSWDWIETDSELINKAAPYGFLTTEVEKHFPEHVFEFGGFQVIDYQKLLEDVNEQVVQ